MINLPPLASERWHTCERPWPHHATFGRSFANSLTDGAGRFPSCRERCRLPRQGIHVHYGKRLAGNERASRISAARRPAFKRPAALIPLESLQLLVLFEAGIVIFPPGPGTAASSRESSCPLSLTLITLPVAFLLVVLRSLLTIVPDDVTLVLDVTVAASTGGSLNGGALLSG